MQIDLNKDNRINVFLAENDICDAKINAEENYIVDINEKELIPISISNTEHIYVKINDVGNITPYSGPYNVIPRKVSQTLETKEKFMNDDVKIDKIRYTETGNDSGGMTVIIGFD